MTLLLIGLNHRTAPVDVREKLAVSNAQLQEALLRMKEAVQAKELVLLSTCNRLEIYLCTESPQKTQATLHHLFQKQLMVDSLHSHLYTLTDNEVVKHLFRVAAGLDSMVLGEHEILGQVKHAYQTGQHAGCTGKLMNVLFQRSLYIGKRIRTETGLSLGSSSVGSVAVAMAERIFGDLRQSRVMILGAGKMADMTARHLLSQKVKDIRVANRTLEKAQEMAQLLGGLAFSLQEGLRQLDQADIVICSMASPHPLIQPQQIRETIQHRKGRSLFFIDIAVPRNVHPDVHKLDNVYVYNIDDLLSIVNETLKNRSQEMRLAEAIVDEKTQEFSEWLDAYYAGKELSLHHVDAPLNP